MNKEQKFGVRRRHVALGAMLGGLLIAGCTSEESKSPYSVCDRFRVYAQNRWEPLGAAGRAELDPASEKVASFSPNEVMGVDGWYDSKTPVYAQNPAPFNNGVYLHLSAKVDGKDAWVSFAGSRGDTTQPDPASLDGGVPVDLKPECQIASYPAK